ncbi:MAG: polyketide cyclase [Firmicutes bacterium]|nr:polyketide cyclase [Bacillota bacterium]
MELQCTIEVNAAKERIWPYYADPAKHYIWEEDLEDITLDGALQTGTTGKMKLKEMPEMLFTLTEVIEEASYCDRTDVPGMGSLFFEHRILRENGKTYIRHGVRLEKEGFAQGDLEFLSGVFADVPGSMMIIKREAER